MLTTANILAAGFINPVFLGAGLLLAAIPIIIHILNRRRFKTVQWAAMEFLLRALRQNRRRLRFEQWLLLAVRCGVLALLGLALARPTGCDKSTFADIAAHRSGLHVIVIDNSYSMAYEAARPDARTHLDQAKLMAKNLISRLASGGESVAIVTAGAPAKAVIIRPVFDLDSARSSIDRIEQLSTGTDLPGAIKLASEIIQSDRQPAKSVHLFSDATRSGWTGDQAKTLDTLLPELAKQCKVTHFNLGKQGQWNHAVTDVAPADLLVRGGFESEFLATARGFGGTGQANLIWQYDGATVQSASVAMSSDSPPVITSITKLGGGGAHLLKVSVGSDDRLRLDNERARVIDVATELKVLIVEGSRGSGPLSGSGEFLATALSPPVDAGSAAVGVKSNSYVATELISDLELGNKALGDYRAVALTGVGSIQPQQADQLKRFVETGGMLMIFMGEAVSSDNYNQTLLTRGLLPGPLTKRVSSAADQEGFLFDFNPNGNLHPCLRAFRGVERTGLETARVFDYWQVDVNPESGVERVLNYLVPGTSSATTRPAQSLDPAITVHSLRDGKVVFVSTTADAEWTSFPAKPNYAALMHELLAGTVQNGDRWMNLLVGQSLVIPATLRITVAPTLTDSQQIDLPLELSASGTGYRSQPIAKPGVYKLSLGNRTMPIAVNVPADEADIRVLDDKALHSAMGDAEVTLESDELPAPSSVADTGRDYGWSIMLAVFAFVALECVLAMRFGHHKRN